MNQVPSIIQKILYVATRSPKIDIDREYEVIKTAIGGHHSQFEPSFEPVVRVDQVSDAIQNRRTPTQIIHISGEGREDGTIEIPDPEDSNKGEELKPEALAQFFEDAEDVNCVLLNFCYSEQAANLIAKHVKCVIGINGDIQSPAAVEFSKAFYNFLEGEPLDQSRVDKAFSKGQAAALAITGGENKYIKQIKLSEPEMQLIEPTEGSNIPRDCKFSGTFSNLSEGASMWAYVNATLERKFYLVPIDDHRSDGTWKKQVLVGMENDTNTYRVGVLIADAEVTKTLNENFAKSGFLRFDNLPNGSKRFGDRAVTRQ
ncbi:hypothetical protein [Nostoc sp. PCC 9305]|uniref:hypothetical protein n=1 Tax=Nostoc sp. PCC 9305 TaxID=296636 RepID=UPI0039C5C83C